ncbi:MAG: hypothetical protein HQM08_03000 [Candidatus Riflebacteria bacterium]|nr:hypothetical protein [Candidatus Riflebacteria bacterium]
MEDSIHPPWDSPGVIVLDGPALLANLDKLDSTDSLIDLRSPILGAIAPKFSSEFVRRGIVGYLASSNFPTWNERLSKFSGFLAPPFDSGILRETIRLGLIPCIGHIGEGILASNEAQAMRRPQKVLLRIRGGNLSLDSGPSGFLPLIEKIRTLPMLEVIGVFLDEPFSTRIQCDQLSRAVSKHLPETRSMMILGAGNGPIPVRFKQIKIISDSILGLIPSNPPLTSTLSIKLWGYPLSETEKGFLITSDVGWRDGIFTKARPVIRVSGETGRIISVKEKRIVVEIPRRPNFPSPFLVTLLGNDFEFVIGPQEWSDFNLSEMVEKMKNHLPSFLKMEGEEELEYF